MAIERNDIDERQTRIDAMIERFRDAQRRRLVTRSIALWRRAEAARAMACVQPRIPVKIH
jgi:hypothetical protein